MQQSRMMAEALSLEPQQPDLESESLDMVRVFGVLATLGEVYEADGSLGRMGDFHRTIQTTPANCQTTTTG